ncbi:STAS domain-containing protein [Pacificimonas sp. WHA3]|uniref:STAS domain-containing protein n=1 Tax=Pacificimonas pallii TaxID=2827236 RepID=A0ABS6SE32_9SPHN|nr:SulP family inorganic anion transporter [Pacificimonas pallii]MBV7256171.1 STAS domain-containing protein [Pacificimonas pallii]
MSFRDLVPPLRWLGDYSARDATSDIVAGLILAVLLVPQAMAYATLAGLPPEVGLYTAIAPPLIYACLGTSPYVSMGPVALASLLVADAVAGSSLDPAEAAAILAVETGAILLAIGALRLGRLVNFISDPALLGFTAAAAVLIAASQLPTLLGIDAERGGTIMATATTLWPLIPQTDVTALIVGGGALLALIIGSRFGRPLLWKLGVRPPWRRTLVSTIPFVVLVICAAAATIWTLDIPKVTQPPSGLPPFGLPPLDMTAWLGLLPSSAVIAAVIFVPGTAVAKSLAGRRRQSLDTSQEALAIGAANVASALSGGYSPGVSFSRSALVYDSGARSPIASGIGALIVLLVVLFLSAPLALLPKTALAALVISAVFGLIKPAQIRSTWRHSRTEGMVIFVTFAATLGLGVQWGLGVGAISGIAAFLWFSSLPRVTRLGERVQGDGRFRSVDRNEVEVDTLPVLAIRFDRSLYFANVGHCEDQLLTLLSRHPEASCLLIDMKGVNDIDASGMAMLERLIENLEEKRLTVGFAEVRQSLQRAFTGHLELERCAIYADVPEGVRRMQEACGDDAG